ncbi:MAG TPA: endolytic transglycosylase MltG [Candidatus Saccharimonadia bacterium]|nr:endolytic transglycosylase MltG [Candidatus Saccharimonadia bacterium]
MKKNLLIIAFVFIVVLVLGALAVYAYVSSPVNPSDNTEVSFIIPKGKGVSWIGENLEQKGLVRSALAFRLLALQQGLNSKIQAGSYTLKKSQSMLELLQTMQKGTNDVWVTVLEGWRNEEVAQALQTSLGDTFDVQQFLTLAKPEQGKLFPDTYLMPKITDAPTALSYMTNNFEKKFTTEMQRAVAADGRSNSDVLTLASIVEREANTVDSKQVVAGILMKRLQAGWALQADATLQYAKGYDAKAKSWWVPPTAEDKSLRSPYNTYLNTGLPPAPISNPGFDALNAAVYPTKTDYWYYLTDNNGKMHYAITLEEQTANVKKYLQ